MRFCLMVVAVFLVSQDAPSRNTTSEQAVVRYAKRLNVADLDPALRSRQLDTWLSSGPAHLDGIEWSRGDCDLKPDIREPREGYPLCVRIDLRRRNAWGWMVITIGNTRTGIQGRPRFERVSVTTKTLAQRGIFRGAKRLSELPKLLSEVEDADSKASGHK